MVLCKLRCKNFPLISQGDFLIIFRLYYVPDLLRRFESAEKSFFTLLDSRDDSILILGGRNSVYKLRLPHLDEVIDEVSAPNKKRL